MSAKSGFARLAAGLVASLLLGSMALADAPPSSVVLRGAGATFPAPLYYKWMETYGKDHPKVTLSYDAVGSGDGVSRFIAGSIDFAASDAAMTDQEIDRSTRGAVLVPATAGLVVLAYNLPGLAAPLRLPRDVYADILLGRIANWNDPRLRQANPGAVLPNRTIAVVARLDKSGTTFALTNHLSTISPSWKTGPGTGTLIEWPRTAMLARGNEGVSSRIKLSEGAIGYVEYGYAKRLGLPTAVLENKAGRFITPDERSGQNTLAESEAAMDSNLRVFITDPAGADSYPLVTYSWLVLYRQYADQAKRDALRDFVQWGLGAGQSQGSALGYIPLPDSVVARGKSALAAIR